MSGTSSTVSLHPDLKEVSIWTVYAFPSDYPRSYVARRFVLRSGRPTMDVLVGPTLEAVRELVAAGADYQLHRIERDPGDDPVIVESWL